ncbi:Uncharacterized protein A9P81_0217 [Leptospira interrogans serovar Copenhageni/Icterohaemorrhagiae]|nr:Uncharacterized protein A9P81_0217 [Leptospira interrogans serovar Copenhageni/Icterohaemorrhagiae]OBZ98682.1 Uncharacterized protein A9P81_3247 [Leptospira interrogans serovar Copenhageni/Icterohaemorrhagiae]OCC28657.1 Uncharacterized protein GNX_2789 [Leptospira interrogans serovar Canicola]
MALEVVKENYSFTNLELKLFGYDMVSFSGFKFDHAVEIELTYGKSGEIVGYTTKNYKRSISAEIYFEELDRLTLLAAPYGGLIEKLPPAPLTAVLKAEGRPDFKYLAPAAKITKYVTDFKSGNSGAVAVPLEIALLSIPIISFA